MWAPFRGITGLLLTLLAHCLTAKLTQFSQSELEFLNSIYFRFCGYEENCYQNGFEQQNILTAACCGSCSCDLTTCSYPVEKSNCCPNYLHVSSLVNRFDNESCINPLLTLAKLNFIPRDGAVMMKDVCTNNESKEYFDKCEKTRLFTTIDTKQPVSVAKETGIVTYKNKYCAFCDDIHENDIIQWLHKLDCYHGTTISSTIETLEEIFDLISGSNRCVLRFELPPLIPQDALTSCGKYISQCNLTGQWDVYNPLIERACRLHYNVLANGYRNVFCLMCNIDSASLSFEKMFRSCSLGSKSESTPIFSALIDFVTEETLETDSVKDYNSRCQNNSVYDPFQEKCLPVECLFYHVYKEGECKMVVKKISRGYIHVFLNMIHLISTGSATDTRNAVAEYTKNLFESSEYELFVENLTVSQCQIEDNPVGGDIIAHFVLKTGVRTHMFDTAILEKLLHQHKHLVSVADANGGEHSYTIELDTQAALTTKCTPSMNISYNSEFPVLLPLHFCPVVHLNSSFYNITMDISGINLSTIGVNIKRNEFLIKDEDFITVCKDTFLDIIGTEYRNLSSEPTHRSISILILYFTLAVYHLSQ